jgi:hypothetical protein
MLIKIKKIFIVLFSLICCLFILELIFRFFPNYEISNFREKNWPIMEHMMPSRILPHEIIPNQPGLSNSLGMYDKEYSIKKPKGIYRILFLGDSITCYGKYTHFLEEKLVQLFPNRFEVWNCAVGGYGTKEYECYLRQRCMRYSPDMVVIGLYIGDDFKLQRVLFRTKGGQLNCYRPLRIINFPVDNWLYCHSFLYRFLMTRLEDYIKYGNKYDFTSQELFGKTYLGKIQNITQKKNIPLLVVVFPYLRPDSEETIEFKVVSKVLDDLRIERIDLHKYFSKNERIHLRKNSNDDCHPNQAGDKIAAEVIFDYLYKKLKLQLQDEVRKEEK